MATFILHAFKPVKLCVDLGSYKEILSAWAWKGAKARQEDAPIVQARNRVMQVPGSEIERLCFTTYN